MEQEDIDSSYKMSEVGFSEKAKNGLRNKSHGIDSDSVEIQEQSFRYLGGELNKYGGSNYVALSKMIQCTLEKWRVITIMILIDS